jgi:hypothetical protein
VAANIWFSPARSFAELGIFGGQIAPEFIAVVAATPVVVRSRLQADLMAIGTGPAEPSVMSHRRIGDHTPILGEFRELAVHGENLSSASFVVHHEQVASSRRERGPRC